MKVMIPSEIEIIRLVAFLKNEVERNSKIKMIEGDRLLSTCRMLFEALA